MLMKDVPVDLSIVLGSIDLPIRQVLKMSRGTTIPFDSGHADPTAIFVGDHQVAEGRIAIEGDRMTIRIARVLARQG